MRTTCNPYMIAKIGVRLLCSESHVFRATLRIEAPAYGYSFQKSGFSHSVFTDNEGYRLVESEASALCNRFYQRNFIPILSLSFRTVFKINLLNVQHSLSVV